MEKDQTVQTFFDFVVIMNIISEIIPCKITFLTLSKSSPTIRIESTLVLRYNIRFSGAVGLNVLQRHQSMGTNPPPLWNRVRNVGPHNCNWIREMRIFRGFVFSVDPLLSAIKYAESLKVSYYIIEPKTFFLETEISLFINALQPVTYPRIPADKWKNPFSQIRKCKLS